MHKRTQMQRYGRSRRRVEDEDEDEEEITLDDDDEPGADDTGTVRDTANSDWYKKSPNRTTDMTLRSGRLI